MKKILYFLCIVLFSTTVYAASDTSNATLNNAQVRFNNGEIHYEPFRYGSICNPE